MQNAFNKELSYKVAKANGLEKVHKYQESVDLWLEITEMTLKASKAPNLSFSYKSMLIDKTKQMIEHIKTLKQKLVSQRRVEQRIEQKPILQKTVSEIENKPTLNEIDIKSVSDSTSKISNKPESMITQDDIKEVKVIKNSEIENLPIGFKEIEPSQEFKILTPHDKDYVKKLISQDHSLDSSKPEKKEVSLPKKIVPDPPSDKSKIICFACGSEIPANSEVCSTCGTNLK